jgi:hypothetical protein
MTYYEKLVKDRDALERLIDLGVVDFRVQVHLHIFERHNALREMGVSNPTKQIAESSKYSKRNVQVILSKMRTEV